jgi:hypothetical protein
MSSVSASLRIRLTIQANMSTTIGKPADGRSLSKRSVGRSDWWGCVEVCWIIGGGFKNPVSIGRVGANDRHGENLGCVVGMVAVCSFDDRGHEGFAGVEHDEWRRSRHSLVRQHLDGDGDDGVSGPTRSS